MTATSPYDVAEHLRTPEEMAACLEACMEEAAGDAAFIANALGDMARARGMSQVASDAGLFPRKPLQGAFGGAQSHARHRSPGPRRSGPEVAPGSGARFATSRTGRAEPSVSRAAGSVRP